MNKVPTTMKALVAYGVNDYRLEREYPVPTCSKEDILVRVEGCGICAGDLKCQHGAAMFWGSNTQPTWVKPPFIPGHEFIGEIITIGENVKGFSIGDRVTAEQISPCGECKFCKTGHYWMCQPHDIYGFQSQCNGGMAEYIILKKTAIVHKIPKDMPFEKAILIEPYACAKHCVDRAQIGCEDVVVISGAGTLGLGMITYSKMKSPKLLISLDMLDNRLEKSKEFGVDITWNISKVDALAEIMKLTDGYGCDIYIEATGNPSSINLGMSMIRKLGRFVEFSVFDEPATLDWSIIGDRKELDVLGSHLSPYCFPFVIENIYNNKLKVDGVLGHVFSLEQWETAFEYATGKHGDLKVAFRF